MATPKIKIGDRVSRRNAPSKIYHIVGSRDGQFKLATAEEGIVGGAWAGDLVLVEAA